MTHVYLVHYDNATHDPEFYIFSTFEGAKKKVEELMDDEYSEWKQIDVSNIANLWQWSDEREYLSIWKMRVLSDGDVSETQPLTGVFVPIGRNVYYPRCSRGIVSCKNFKNRSIRDF